MMQLYCYIIISVLDHKICISLCSNFNQVGSPSYQVVPVFFLSNSIHFQKDFRLNVFMCVNVSLFYYYNLFSFFCFCSTSIIIQFYSLFCQHKRFHSFQLDSFPRRKDSVWNSLYALHFGLVTVIFRMLRKNRLPIKCCQLLL